MQFDYIVGNPPYQKMISNGFSKPLWDKIVVKLYDILKNKGHMNIIHPGTWRFANKSSGKNIQKVKEIYLSNNVKTLDMCSMEDGLKTFGVSTGYDVIHMIKEPAEKTLINNKLYSLDELEYIPNTNIELYTKIKAKPTEDTIDIDNDRYAYATHGKYTKKEKDDKFKYPCIYAMPLKGIQFYYSNTKNRGHFGKPKLIIAKASKYTLLDLEGKYGMTEYAYGIYDTKENLIQMQKVFDSPYFHKIISDFMGNGALRVCDNKGSSMKLIRTFRKDFWKDLMFTIH
jgi:hypothetical protein